MTPVATSSTYLEVNGIPLHTKAYYITNLGPAMVGGPTLKGGDLDIPSATGALGFPRHIAPTVRQFAMVVDGRFTSAGTANSDSYQGLVDNCAELTSGLGFGTATGAGTVTARWWQPSGGTVTAGVHVLRFDTQDLNGRNAVKAVLEISILQGTFT